jgi:dienelactone hydrolase
VFRRFIAFYPGCRGAAAAKGWGAEGKLDILMGEADDWTPIAPCRALAGQAAGVTLHGFAGAYHDFDAPVPMRVIQNIPTSQNADRTVHVGGDAGARAAALDLVVRLVLAR